MAWSGGGTGGGGAVNSVVGVAGQTVVNDLGAGNFEVGLDDPLILNQVSLEGHVDLKSTMDVDVTDGQLNGNGKVAL